MRESIASEMYKESSWCRENAISTFNDANTQLQLYTKNDPEVKRKDTARALIKILSQLKRTLEHMNHGTQSDKEQNFYLTYNGTLYIYDIC